MKTNEKGLSLIKEFEGLKLRSYLCPANVWTIGVGHTKTAKPNMVITEARAKELLRSDLAEFEAGVSKLVKVPLTSDQFSALVSLAFNVGLGNVASSTLLKKLNEGDYQGAADQFPRWNKAAGKVLAGLTRRREAERVLWLDS